MARYTADPVRCVCFKALTLCITWFWCTSDVSAQFSGGPGVGGALGCVLPSIVLPVEMLWMKASCENGAPTLIWTTATEQNSAHFVIERSTDAAAWDAAGRVTGLGNSQLVTEYAWTDPAPLPFATMYYRLRQVDLDGREEVFPVLSVERCFKEQGELAVMPNPTDGWVMIGWHAVQENGQVSALRVLDVHGRVVHEQAVHPDTPAATQDLTVLAAGTYTVVALDKAGKRVATARLVRQ